MMINCRSFSTIDIARFLEPWRAQLVSYGMFALPKSIDDTNRLWETVNRMTSLKKLHLIIPTQYRLPDNFPIISQLQIFALMNYPNDNLVRVFAQISSKILLILSNVLFGPSHLEELVRCNPLVTQRVIGFDYGYMLAKENRVENYKKLFHLSCEKFTEIEFLDLMVSCKKLKAYLPEISPNTVRRAPSLDGSDTKLEQTKKTDVVGNLHWKKPASSHIFCYLFFATYSFT